MNKLHRWIMTALILALLVTQGCGSLVESRSFVNPEADFSYYERVAVMPFGNMSADRFAGEKMTEVFMTELLIGGEMEVMDPGQFNAVVAQALKGRGGPMGPADYTRIGEFAEVQGIFVGTIHDYKLTSAAGEQYPLISMTVKFIDAPTGTVAWQISITATGGPNLPIVSIGETYTLGAFSQKMCRKVVKDFLAKAFSK